MFGDICVGGFNKSVGNHKSLWKSFSNDPCFSNLWTEITMLESNNEYTGEHTVPLCNLTMGSLSQYAVNCT